MLVAADALPLHAPASVLRGAFLLPECAVDPNGQVHPMPGTMVRYSADS